MALIVGNRGFWGSLEYTPNPLRIIEAPFFCGLEGVVGFQFSVRSSPSRRLQPSEVLSQVARVLAAGSWVQRFLAWG